MGFSSQDIDEDDDDKLAAVMESWQSSIKRQAQLLMSLAISRKRNELLLRRKDGSVVQEVVISELAQLERAWALETKQHKNAQDGLRRWGMQLEARLNVSTQSFSVEVGALEERYAEAMRTLSTALEARGEELEIEQSRTAAMVERLKQEEEDNKSLQARATAAEARAASLERLEASSAAEIGTLRQTLADERAAHREQLAAQQREAAAAAAAAERAREDAVFAATNAVRNEAESAATVAVRQQAEREAALLRRAARAEACVTHTAFVRNAAARVLCRLLTRLKAAQTAEAAAFVVAHHWLSQ